MLKLLMIDDKHCKEELSTFISKHKKAVITFATTTTLTKDLQALLRNIEEHKGHGKRLAVSTTESLTLLNVGDITRCESNRNYTYIYLTGKQKLIASKTLMDFEEVLNKYGFLRIHKSHLINVSYMDKYVKSDGGYVVMQDGSKLPVAIRKKEYLFRELEKL